MGFRSAFGRVVAVAALALSVVALVAPVDASAAATGTQWVASGPGTVTVGSDGTTVAPRFNFHQASSGPSTWTFSTVATAAGTVTLPYDYFGFYAFFQVRASLSSFITHSSVTTPTTLVSTGPSNCCSAPSNGFNYTGTVSFIVQPGDTYGFTLGGSNGDSNHTLQATLDLGTAQTITFPQLAVVPLGRADTALSASSSSGLAPTFTSTTPSVCTVVNGAAHLLTLGTCSIAADQAGNLTYDPAGTVTRSFTVTQAAPSVTAQASASGAVGTTISDTATLTGAFSPTGTITFSLYGPNDPTCAATPIFSSTTAVSGPGPYHSGTVTPAAVGTYRWVAHYAGDVNNLAATGACADTGQIDSLSLAATGPPDSTQLLGLGLLLLGLGVALLLLARRRTTTFA